MTLQLLGLSPDTENFFFLKLVSFVRNLHLKQSWGIPSEAGQKQSRPEATILELVQETEVAVGRESGHPSPGPAHVMGLLLSPLYTCYCLDTTTVGLGSVLIALSR